MYDLRAEYHVQKDAIDAAIERVLESGVLIMGPELTAFEDEFARFCGTGYAVGVSSGTAALHLAAGLRRRARGRGHHRAQ